MDSRSNKRSRSRSPSTYHRQPKPFRQDFRQSGSRRSETGGHDKRGQDSFALERSRRNEVHEEAQMREWVAKEDDFVLKQTKKKALIRVREGRATPIDWLVVIMSVVDPTRDILEEDSADPDLDIIDPEGVLETLDVNKLKEVEIAVEEFKSLETNKANRAYWDSISTVCNDRRNRLQPSARAGRGISAVVADVDKLLASKSLNQLLILEDQVRNKLQSNEIIDEDYWEQLLSSIGVYKARAQLKSIYSSIVETRLKDFRARQIEEAEKVKSSLLAATAFSSQTLAKVDSIDPQPQLKIRPEDKSLQTIEESKFLSNIGEERRRIQKLGYVPRQTKSGGLESSSVVQPRDNVSPSNVQGTRFARVPNEDHSQTTKAMYDREVARGVQEDEEIFTGEEEVFTKAKAQWAGDYQPRKPRYFNRVQMGYEWNKYNQTHYDHDNPPPKVVQGYKFNIFYPDLIDKTKAPTYRIERENGRKRGQTFAPAGEEDTCLIRFTSGPPYEDLAFRIVDKEWDYSAKHERGFRSSFDKGILQLHFQFKKVYYRK